MRSTGVCAALIVGLAALALQAGCAGAPHKPAVASVSGRNAPGSPDSSAAAAPDERPRHRVDETDADRERIIAPWRKCMKDNGADLDQMPPNIQGATQWMNDHARAGDTCSHLQPLPAWGLDRTNPEYRDNIHNWVKCMRDKGLNVIETPDDDESPWRFAGNSNVPAGESDTIEHDCEVATVGKSDR